VQPNLYEVKEYKRTVRIGLKHLKISFGLGSKIGLRKSNVDGFLEDADKIL